MGERQQAIATELVDSPRARVTRFNFAPGAQTGWHTHGMDYVIVAVTDCTMMLEEPDGATRSVQIAAGESYARARGVEHNVINGGDADMSFVEVELKGESHASAG